MKRPGAVTTLLFMVLCLTAWNAVRLYASIADWDTLADFAPRPGPIYIAVTASAWTLGGLVLFDLFRRRSARARLFALAYFLGYAAWWWLDRLLLQQPQPNGPFALAATLTLLAILCMALLNKKARKWFGNP
ncbi:MAG: hypothetical protein DYG87_03810 [Anaerolineae bacterium CFX3]|jgi:hypothetical protein|nr:hypothetical protein [Anaerolineales bacterium]MCE7904908.1 hypothetical protein [Anaerolineae bacterium CFX3]MCQ3945728.1 hypothetical protein [Anaerolineae bacterium]OQY85936.1 MAG: hypothetical protein B6D40_02355 [Anaerolineae bacterium UTCFX3]MCL4824660.1 hypothetical protein [Anaerolineales bacterium]